MTSLLCHQYIFFFFSSRRRHTRFDCDWSSDVCSSDLSRSLLPRLTTTATSSRSSPSACRCAPVPMASIETNTPTAQVTPIRIVSTAPLRAARPPRLSRSRAVDCRRKFMTFFLALGQCGRNPEARREQRRHRRTYQRHQHCKAQTDRERDLQDRKSTRLNSSHSQISYAVFCLKKKKHT